MKRLPHWEFRLAAHFQKLQTTPFQWGLFDCALAVCDAADAISGLSIASNFRGKYSTEEGAIAILGGDPSAPLGACLGAFAANIAAQNSFREWTYRTSAAPKMAHRGDAVLINNSLMGGAFSTALGTVDLTGRYAWCAASRGFIRVPMRRWLRAWHIG